MHRRNSESFVQIKADKKDVSNYDGRHLMMVTFELAPLLENISVYMELVIAILPSGIIQSSIRI